MNARSNFWKNKALAVHINKGETETDQSQADDTDINVIVKRHTAIGSIPGTTRQPIYTDMTQLPRGLRDMIETARALPRALEQLPEKLRTLPLHELLTLTPDKANEILNPPAPPPADPNQKEPIK